MTRTPLLAAALVFAATATASAQAGLYSKAKAVTQRAVAATNAHVEAEQHPEAKAPAAKPAQSAAVQQGAATSAKGKAAASAAGAAQSGQPVTKLNIASADTIPPALIMRESFDYSRDGRRDPFVSLLTTNELRPTMSDLRLTGILYDISGNHSVATLRDLSTNELYRVAAGSPLGRMRVSVIRLKSVVFTIDEFGTTRQDSLVLGDSTKARGK
ncbi:MAG TPA: hypothetical protein VN651_17600 [Gemmatimonadaceae bacterium]|nr:hypothetical protein [Gemmatimonadaceae bacterium]